jgi:uncharacterized protein
MGADAVFVDTWALLALTNRDDARHAEAVALGQQFFAERRPHITSEWVLTEFLGGAARPPLRLLAIESVRRALASPRTEVIYANHSDWRQAFEIYESHADKSWSLIDCLSILICRTKNITDVFTGDRHFEQAGLNAIPGTGYP